jgi:ribosomal protein S18 acetylase RimI-like enzyme
MHIYRLSSDRAAVRRFSEELWLPFHRELEATTERHALAEDLDLSEEVEFRMDKLESDTYHVLVAVDGTGESTADSLADGDGDFAGFIAVSVDESSPVFDNPDRLIVGDIFVHELYRGDGLAQRLMDRAVERAREEDCEELVLNVDIDNERALAFYEKLGFETYRRKMGVGVDEVETDK